MSECSVSVSRYSSHLLLRQIQRQNAHRLAATPSKAGTLAYEARLGTAAYSGDMEHQTTQKAPTLLPWSDPRDDIEFSVLMANGRLAPRSFANHDDAVEWARPDLGDEVVSFNNVCACDR